jgi:hypothetical protein
LFSAHVDAITASLWFVTPLQAVLDAFDDPGVHSLVSYGNRAPKFRNHPKVLLLDEPLGALDAFTIPVDLRRPRDRSSGEFLQLRGEILELLHFAGGAAV